MVADDGGGVLQQRKRRRAPGLRRVFVEGELRLFLGAGAGAARRGALGRQLDAGLGRLGRGPRAVGFVLRLGQGDGGRGRAGGPRLAIDGGAQDGGGRSAGSVRGGAGGAGRASAVAAGAGGRGQIAGLCGALGGPGQRLAGEAVGAGVDQDRSLAHEAGQRPGLGPGDAERIARGQREDRGERDADHRQRDRDIERERRQQRGERRVAEQAAKAVGVGPAREGDVGGGEGGGGEERHRQRQRAAPRAAFAGVQHQAQTPGGERDGQAVGRPAERAVQRIRDRGADQAERVARRLVGGAEQARIVRGVGPEQGPGQHAEGDKREADEFRPAAAQRLFGIALHERAAAFALGAGSHVRPFRWNAARRGRRGWRRARG